MQTLGLPALSEGNVIIINETRIGVVEACSGLSMLVIFFALSTAFALVLGRQSTVAESSKPEAADKESSTESTNDRKKSDEPQPQYPLWQRLVLVASAVPIALIANITRITVTGIMHETVGHRAADMVFHDLAGWLMMPFALVLLWLELKALGRLFVVPTKLVAITPNEATLRPTVSRGSRRKRPERTYVPPTPHKPRSK
jgi:exosortase/archaeosortase family protein